MQAEVGELLNLSGVAAADDECDVKSRQGFLSSFTMQHLVHNNVNGATYTSLFNFFFFSVIFSRRTVSFKEHRRRVDGPPNPRGGLSATASPNWSSRRPTAASRYEARVTRWRDFVLSQPPQPPK